MIHRMGKRHHHRRRASRRHPLWALWGLLCLASLNLSGGSLAQPLKPFTLERHGFEVIERLPMDRDNFTQGLQVVGDTLYVGSGLYGASHLREYAWPGMTLRREIALPEELFGEGVTRLGERIYQLTWRAGQLRVHNAETLALERVHAINTEGWGITHNGSELIYSDGSDQLYVLDPQTLALRRTITVTINGRPLPQLNELEWIRGEIWANVFRANQLVRIEPDSGRVKGVVDLRGLLDPADRAEDTDVLNGIAWDAQREALWVTGKRWPWLFNVRLTELAPAT